MNALTRDEASASRFAIKYVGLYWAANRVRARNFVSERDGRYATYGSRAKAEAAIRRTEVLRVRASDLEVVPDPASTRGTRS